MANQTLKGDWKACATCNYWGGRRSTHTAGHSVEFDQKEEARCNVTSYHVTKGIQPGCQRYEKVSWLK